MTINRWISTTQKARPFVKWAGGKSRVINQLLEFFPDNFNSYYEPFLGGGSLYFSISPQKGRLNDMNCTLIDTYIHIRDNCQLLTDDLERLQLEYFSIDSVVLKKDFYYQRREEFNATPKKDVRKSSLFVFLNKTGFNGMYRENSKGEYNIPFGKHNKPLICDKENLLIVSEVLKQIEISCGSYELAIKDAKAGDFVYLDPPYEPINPTSNFNQYLAGGFTKDDQRKVYKNFCELSDRGCYVMMSNSTADLIKDLYSKFTINKISVGRTISSATTKRGKIEELVVTNYKPNIGRYIKNLESNVK